MKKKNQKNGKDLKTIVDFFLFYSHFVQTSDELVFLPDYFSLFLAIFHLVFELLFLSEGCIAMKVGPNRPRIYPNASKALPSVKKMIDTKKVKGPDSQLYTSICPIVYVIRVFGLAPYEFHNDMLVPSSVNSIFSYACAFVYSYIIYNTLVRFMALEPDKPLVGYTETGKVCQLEL